MPQPYIIVLGNEKGGTGKSTVAMHIIVGILRQNYTVGSIDVDARQGTLSRYIDNRCLRKKLKQQQDLPIPFHLAIFRSDHNDKALAEEEEKHKFKNAIDDLSHLNFIVIDTPGSNTFLSQFAHSYADTLITPLNDSFIDLDMLVRVTADDLNIIKPSIYAEMVWEQKKQKAVRIGKSMDWIVLRNRLSSLYSKNKEEMEKILNSLSKRIGFRTLSGFGERVIFRELFLSGLTLLDMRENNMTMSLSHLAAKQELSVLLDMILASSKM